MFRTLRLAAISAVLAIVCIAPPAAAEECVEVFQFKHCLEP